MASVMGFTFTGSAPGSLAGVNFSSATPLTITGTYDTADITQRSPTLYSVLVDSISVAISGMGAVTVNDPVNLFVNTSSGRVGINDNGVFGLYQATAPLYFENWYLSTPIGPIATSSASIDSGLNSAQTTGGALVFSGWTSSGTFTAADAVPEPAGFGLAGLGLAVAALIRRRSI